ncbi:NAD-dependent succinate-semialdehyde dehydrogenase [Leucobacter luti]|uniref:Succinate semialdehyde dehydrogenase n=1 Tax=Leucobacter luti TaxID=340320 RepID=A0A4R6RU41_9MICO|nr:NAD-dependent succinate-semialdehyde dehydrogenase [Leucobacter luti]MCW2288026.1 succinate-semialdehyde dehydrogenase/glutarate-semialdehyde dehydrogenase [Leucobacter luti]QYM75984.1 NAD-dependent succinate-semialdehyde dehydrogenase [Leucobacter luti]TCK45812.1 succinate semialdehyde dehydrogenase [Leucobacter luti]TDP90294.1 succinate semialdehyde dehydrogenase [Leucobacter luti]
MALKPNEQDLLNRVEAGLGIGGTWEPATSGATLDVHDPATGEVIKSIADATVEDAVRALDAAVAAQESWGNTPSRERSNILRRAYDLLMERKEEFALLMSMEMGKPIAEARGEVNYGGEFLRWFSEEAVRVKGDYRQNPEGTGNMLVSHLPVGPCYFITPWNFPLAMATRKIAPALAAGCTVVIKPAALTPLTTIFFAQLLEEAGLPAGVVNVVATSKSSAQSSALLSDPRLRKLSFTGSTPVGVKLLEAAAQNVLRTSMELGGNAPFIVFEDADLDRAVEGAMLAKFRNIGQACTAANRVIVHESVADEFVRRVSEKVAAFTIGRGAEEGNDIGALVDDKAVANTARLVQDAVDTGATVVTGGEAIDGPGSFFQPTVVDHLTPQSAIMREEIFGPLLGVIRFSTEDEAVEIANNTEYGLISYVFTENIHRGHRMIEKLESGMMGLNTGLVSNAAAPFGGLKQSGLGREGGFEGIHEFLSSKYTLLPR